MQFWRDLATGDRARLLTQKHASLWLLPDAKTEDIEALIDLPWLNIWDTGTTLDIPLILRGSKQKRTPIIVRQVSDDVSSYSPTKFVRVYGPASISTSKFTGLNDFLALQLKERVSNAVGILLLVGNIESHLDDVFFIQDVAPQLHLAAIWPDNSLAQVDSTIPICRFDTINEFTAAFTPALTPSKVNLINLRDAENLELDETLIESIEKDWTLLSANRLSGKSVSQDDFDRFLNGDPAWHVFALDAPHSRKFEIRLLEELYEEKHLPLYDVLILEVDKIEATVTDPRNTLHQIRLFCEPGSGTTTALRQAATKLAMLGYPVLVSNPNAKKLSAQTTAQFIIDTQDKWRSQRRGGMRGAHGNIPFLLFVDKDLDEEIEHQRLARGLSSLGREIILVRAFERSRDEIARAKDVLCLRADVPEAEMLKLGAHLRQFAQHHRLAPIPSDDEWRAYHQGLNVMARFNNETPWSSALEDVPHLFLVGISPFISDRIHDVNSLQQYYFQKYDALPDEHLKLLVHTVAAAGAFGISIPYDSLRRIDELNLGSLESLSRLSHRLLDVFLHWQHEDVDTAGWYLRIRHPIVGRLLSDAIDPVAGYVPFKPLLPVLRQLTTKEDDVWFARSLVARIGKYFKRRAPSFSLETDTPVQRAARAIFSAIPSFIKDESRTLMHHEARYHMHVLHACLDAIHEPSSTTLTLSSVEDILKDEFVSAESILRNALTTDDLNEPEKFVLNTYAMLNFNYAQSSEPSSATFAKHFSDGLDLQEQAISHDASDSLARYQFVHEIFQTVPNGAWSLEEKLEYYARAELRLQELIAINQERTIKNVDPVEADVQIGTLFDLYKEALSSIPNSEQAIQEYTVRNPEAGIALAVRRILGTLTLQDAWTNSSKRESLSELRSELEQIANKSARSLLFLYRLYLEDPTGRFEFERRLAILNELKRKSTNEYTPYWHDEAALLCQVDNLDRGAQRFKELRSFRNGQRVSQSSQWFWVNERALLETEKPPRLRQISFSVKDPSLGIASVRGTTINIRYQPYQFPEFRTGDAFQAYVRFTINGMQAVPEALAKTDLKAMGMT